MNSRCLFFLGVSRVKKIILLVLMMFFSNAYADWSESYGGDGVVAGFTLVARSLAKEMENNPDFFTKEFTDSFKKSIEETIISSADKLILNNVEKDAINHTLEKPYLIEVSRARWLQYEASINTQEKLVLHEYLFTLHIDDSNYIVSSSIYNNLIYSRMYKKDDSRLGPYLIQAAADCNIARVTNVIDMGANVELIDNDNRNALFVAAEFGCSELVNKFINMGVPGLKSNKNSWGPWFVAFVGAHRTENDPKQFKKYSNTLITLQRYYLDVDSNSDAVFLSGEFPPQVNSCVGQTMFMRSLIGITFYTDEKKLKVINVRNLKIARLLKMEGASLDLKDSCGMSAKDYAELYKIDLKNL